MEFHNGKKMRKDNTKPGPSGVSRNTAFSLPESWGGRNCLLPVDINVIRQLKEELGGEELLEFTSAEFSAAAQQAYDSLGIGSLRFENAWDVFTAMYNLLVDVI